MLVYRPNIKAIENAIEYRRPFKSASIIEDNDRTSRLFKPFSLEPMINNVFAFEKTDKIDLSMLTELSVYGFKIVEGMDHYLVSGSISDIIHLVKFCKDKNVFMDSIIDDLKAYYSPEYFHQLIEQGFLRERDFSVGYKDQYSSQVRDTTLYRISLLHCDMLTYSLNHYFDEYLKDPLKVDQSIKSRDKITMLCDGYKDLYKKIDISFTQISKILNISYFIYDAQITDVTDFINKNKIKDFAYIRSIDIMQSNKNDVVLVTQSLYDFLNIKFNPSLSVSRVPDLFEDIVELGELIKAEIAGEYIEAEKYEPQEKEMQENNNKTIIDNTIVMEEEIDILKSFSLEATATPDPKPVAGTDVSRGYDDVKYTEDNIENSIMNGGFEEAMKKKQ